MLNFENAKVDSAASASVEPAKAILDNTNAILTELSNQLERIECALYGQKQTDDMKEDPDASLLELLNRQRCFAEKILKTAVHIKDGLW